MLLEQIDYGSIFAGISSGPNWLDDFKRGLKTSNVHVETRSTLWIAPSLHELASVSLIYYFVPLLVWIAWIASRLWPALSRPMRNART